MTDASSRRMIITGGRLLDAASGEAPARDILISGGMIEAIAEPGFASMEDVEIVSAEDHLLVPGLVNAHTHGHSGLTRGTVGDRAPLEMFLNTAGAALASQVTEDKYLSAALTAAEMIRHGVTACYDLCVEIPRPTEEGFLAVAKAYDDSGMRAVIAPMIADRTLYQALPGVTDSFPDDLKQHFDRLALAPPSETLATCAKIYKAWSFDRERIRPAIAPTIPIHCSDEFLRGCGQLAEEFDLRIQTHLGETKTQAEMGLRKYGHSLTTHLANLGLVTPRLSAAHAIWIDDDAMSRLADGGARVAHNPLSNLRLGSGIAAVRRMLDRGLPVGIGTDGSNTSDGQNMFEATRLAAYLSRIWDVDPESWITANEALDMATVGSAAILGFSKIGRIAPGFAADIVFLGLDAPHFVPLRAPVLQTVFAENSSSIRRVMVGGRTIFEDGRLLTMDEAQLRRRAEEAAERLSRANARASATAASVSRLVGHFCMGLCRAPHPVRRNFACLPDEPVPN